MCDVCQGKRHTYDAATGEWVRCACLEEEIVLKHCIAAGLPEACCHASISSLVAHTPALTGAKAALSMVGQRLATGVQVGQICLVGQAKSARLLGGLLVKASLSTGTGLFATIDDLTHSSMRDRARTLHTRARRVNTLALVLGHEHPNPFDRSVAEAILDERDVDGKTTIVVTTRSKSDLENRYGARSCWLTPIVLPAEEFRL